jgi:hypothetical protein
MAVSMAACLKCRNFHGVSNEEAPHELLIEQYRYVPGEGASIRWVCGQCGRIWKVIDYEWEQVSAY